MFSLPDNKIFIVISIAYEALKIVNRQGYGQLSCKHGFVIDEKLELVQIYAYK